MADVTGPISTLPGCATHEVPAGMCCDNHADRPATVRVQGETDSFGSEMYDLCGDCARELRDEMRNADTSGVCDWCKERAPKLFGRRDYEEGFCGRVYQVCRPCIDEQNARDQEEWDRYDNGGYYDD